MTKIRCEIAADEAAREGLLDAAFGLERHLKTSEQLRKDRIPSAGLAFIAEEKGKVVGTVRLWDIVAGSAGPALLLGPLAVAAHARGRGIGSSLMRRAIAEATAAGHSAIVLVGDAPFYRKFGFSPALVKGLDLPGPTDRRRFLGLELESGALKGAAGDVLPWCAPTMEVAKSGRKVALAG